MNALTDLANYLPQIAVIAAIFGFIGWSLHKMITKPAAETSSPAKAAPAAEKGRLERVKNLETLLEKSKAAQKSLKAELEQLQAKSVPIADFEKTVAELDTARKSLETEGKRLSTLEADLKKSQETIKHLNARANDADKAQKDRSFALENELSKVREQLAVFQNAPDDTKGLEAEIERLRESVAVSTRYAGEMRKREAAALEALEKAESKLSNQAAIVPTPAAANKVGPVQDSSRIAAAKAEVIRLSEMNKQKEIAAQEVEEVVVVAPVEDLQPVLEELPAVIEEVQELATDSPETAKAPPATELFALD